MQHVYVIVCNADTAQVHSMTCKMDRFLIKKKTKHPDITSNENKEAKVAVNENPYEDTGEGDGWANCICSEKRRKQRHTR